MTAERGRERDTLVRKFFNLLERNLLKLSFVETKQKNKKFITSHKKKREEREQKQPPPKKTKKTKKNKKKQKSCLMHKNLFSSSSKNSLSLLSLRGPYRN